MKLDGNPFPQNMIGFSINMMNADEPKGNEKVNVLTSEKAKQDGSVDPTRHLNRCTRKSLTSRIVKLKWANPLNPE
jgi:hypothetical protein